MRARAGARGRDRGDRVKTVLKSAPACRSRMRRRHGGAATRGAMSAKLSAGDAWQGGCGNNHRRERAHDFQRTLKQALYNFFFYGPVQHHWYIALAAKFPAKAFALTAEMATLPPRCSSTKPSSDRSSRPPSSSGARGAATCPIIPPRCDETRPTLRNRWSFCPRRRPTSPWCRRVTKSCTCPRVPSWNVILSLNLNK